MPGFSAECQLARAAYETADAAWLQAIRTKNAAKSRKENAELVHRRALDELNAAINTLNDLESQWDAIINSVRTDPTLATQFIVAEFRQQGPIPSGGEAIGPFPVRNQPNHALIGLAEVSSALKDWANKGSRILSSLVGIVDSARKAKVIADDKLAVFDQAQNSLDDATKAFDQAESSLQAAKQAYDAAESEVKSKCSGQSDQSKHGGIDMEICPGTLQKDEQELKDTLDRIPDKEKKGLTRVRIIDGPGHKFEWEDANTQKKIPTTAAGTYGGGEIDIYHGGSFAGPRTIKHEIGHHVYSILSDASRKKWDDFWLQGNNKLQTPLGKMPTDYSSRNSDEGFAESYQRYRCGGVLDPETRKMMQDILEAIP